VDFELGQGVGVGRWDALVLFVRGRVVF
jgi:hypothetical protein